MTKFDKDYLELVKRILKEGVEVENRTGINTLKVSSHMFEFDLRREFPILETKQTAFKNAILEMLWIWKLQSNDVGELHKRGVNIWDEWMIDDDGIYRIYEPIIPGKEYSYDPDREVVVMDPFSVPVTDPFGKRYSFKAKYDQNGKVMMAKGKVEGKTIKAAKYYGKELAGTIGTVYGWNNARYGYTQDIIYTAKNCPTDRRMNYDLGQREFFRTAVLPPCVYGTEWDITGGTLNLLVHQRSCDVPLGLPFNVTQYATLLLMMAQVTGLEAGTISYSIKDAHIYVNQLEGIKEQLRREKVYDLLSRKGEREALRYQEYLKQELIRNKNLSEQELKVIQSDLKITDMILEPVKPELWLNPEIDDFFLFDDSRELKDIKIKKYKNMGKVDMPIAQ